MFRVLYESMQYEIILLSFLCTGKINNFITLINFRIKKKKRENLSWTLDLV